MRVALVAMFGVCTALWGLNQGGDNGGRRAALVATWIMSGGWSSSQASVR